MNQSNSERSGELKQSIISAVIRVCQQKLKFMESVHIAGCLSFSIDNVEKLNVVISEVVMVCPASVPVPPLSFPKPETPSNLERDGQIQGRSDAREDDDLQLNTRGQNDVLQSADDDKTELKELVKATELNQIVPVVGIRLPFSGPSVNVKPVHFVRNNLSSPAKRFTKETVNTVTKTNGRHHLQRRIDVRSKDCDKSFVSTAELRSHVTQVHPQLHKCPQCPEQFSVYDDVMEHMKVAHGVDGDTVPCEWCNRKFITFELLQEHILLRHKKVCTICQETFTDQRKLVLHRRTDHPKIPGHRAVLSHQCTICNKSYKRVQELKSHVRVVHDKLKPFLCSTCGKSFPYKQSLRLHLMLHNDERPFPCSFCKKSFVSRALLHAHEESHDTSAVYVCDVCHKLFRTARLLYKHRRQHTSDGERFMCDVCGQRFMNLSRLESHRFVHSDRRPHKCETCNKTYKTYGPLKQHLLIHLPSPSNHFVCAICEKSFKRKGDLREHRNRHLRQRTFVCQLCAKAFLDKVGLTRHLRAVHVAQPRYACPACGKTSDRANRLREHMKRHGNPELLKLSNQELAVVKPK